MNKHEQELYKQALKDLDELQIKYDQVIEAFIKLINQNSVLFNRLTMIDEYVTSSDNNDLDVTIIQDILRGSND